MVNVIALREVVETMEALSDDSVSYLDPDSGEIFTLTEEERRLAVESDELVVYRFPTRRWN